MSSCESNIDVKQYYKETVQTAASVAASYYGLPVGQIFTTSRKSTTVKARQLAVYLARQGLKLSYPEIASGFGLDSSTVRSSCKHVENDVALSKSFRSVITGLVKLVKTGEVTAVQPTGTAVVFPEQTWRGLKELRETGLFGEDIHDVIIRLVGLKLFELGIGGNYDHRDHR